MARSKYTEDDFRKILQSGGPTEFAYLYDAYSDALYAIVLKIVIDEDLAADTLQDIFIKIWDKRSTYDDSKGSIFTWMLNIARNSAIDVTRSARFKSISKIRNIDDNVSMINRSAGINTNTDVIGVNDVVDALPEDQRNIIDLMYYKGMSQEEISKEFDIPLGTVKTRARNAIGKLRQFFNVGIKP